MINLRATLVFKNKTIKTAICVRIPAAFLRYQLEGRLSWGQTWEPDGPLSAICCHSTRDGLCGTLQLARKAHHGSLCFPFKGQVGRSRQAVPRERSRLPSR